MVLRKLAAGKYGFENVRHVTIQFFASGHYRSAGLVDYLEALVVDGPIQFGCEGIIKFDFPHYLDPLGYQVTRFVGGVDIHNTIRGNIRFGTRKLLEVSDFDVEGHWYMQQT
jgi:hypothetical protein